MSYIDFEQYPFEKLNNLLSDITPNKDYEPISLTIGEPQFQTPLFIQEGLKESTYLLNKYPKSSSEDYLKDAMLGFLKRRFDVTLDYEQLIPTYGTREVLFNFPQFYLFGKNNKTMAFPNPFYQIYEGAAKASNAKIIHMNLTKENNFLCSLTPQQMQQTDLVILNYPNNPTSATISKKELAIWIENALKYDFLLLNDECYSELYFDENNKPVSLLEVSKDIGNDQFKNCLVLNSISKRSSAPGLRSGFIAGDKTILKEYMKYRTYVGCASSLPLQVASAKAWSDDKHVEQFRQQYKQNFQIANEILQLPIPKATFYIWQEVEDELELTKQIYQEQNIKLLPGSFLGRDGIGKGYVRIALVQTPQKTKDILQRLKQYL